MARLLPTELIGSYALPSWLWIALERIEHQNDLGPADISETLEDAVSLALLDQVRAGLDVVTDGEMRRRDFIQNFYGKLQGLVGLPPARRLGAAGYDQNPRWQVVGRIAAPAGLGIAEEVAFLKRHADRPFKVCVPGPITLSLPLLVKDGYADKRGVIEEMIGIVNAEMKALAAAGADYLQVDEPRYATSHADADYLVDVFNAVRADVPATVGLHLCFGNFKGRAHDPRDYGYILPSLNRARCDQVNLEFANREYAQLELLAQIDPRMRIGLGVLDVKSYFVESPEAVARGIRRALEHVAPERIVVTPDCGFNHCPRHVAYRKMCALVEGAAIVRRELES